MDNWYYHRIIFECLTRNNLVDKELEPVKDEFFKILHHFKSLGKFEYSDTTSSCVVADCKFVEQLIDVLKLVIKKKKINILDDKIDFLINTDINYENFPSCLKAFIFDTKCLDFFNECLNDNLIISKYEPVKEYLFKIIKHYSKMAPFKFDDIALYGMHEISFVKELFETFDIIMANNAYDNLDESIEYLFELDVVFWYFCRFLKAIIFKDKNQGKNMDIQDYYHTIRLLCSNELEKNTNSDIRIARIIRRYQNYFIDETNEGLTDYEREKYKFYRVIAPFIIGEFYLTDLDINYLNKVLANVLKKYDEDLDYLSVNGLDNRYDREQLAQIAKILLKCHENKKNIK